MKATAHVLRNANASWSFASAFSGSTEAFGFVNSIIVDEDKTILADTGGLRLPKAQAWAGSLAVVSVPAG
jgi:hypothetical protein